MTEECNQLRKNLTLTTIESESRKAEVTTLVSQITILEATIKVINAFYLQTMKQLQINCISLQSLRDSSERHTQLEQSFEQTTLELKKKHEDYKKLQQVSSFHFVCIFLCIYIEILFLFSSFMKL